jgi:hypothetical protein
MTSRNEDFAAPRVSPASRLDSMRRFERLQARVLAAVAASVAITTAILLCVGIDGLG